jgi:hypothetical protein
MRDQKLAQAAERIALTLRAQGVGEIRAAEFVEQHVELKIGPGLKVYATCGEHRARGSSDEHLIHFARLLHLHHPELGGHAKPFGLEEPPPFEGETQHAAHVTAVRKAHAEAVQRKQQQADERDTRHRQEHADFELERGPDPAGSF